MCQEYVTSITLAITSAKNDSYNSVSLSCNIATRIKMIKVEAVVRSKMQNPDLNSHLLVSKFLLVPTRPGIA